MALTTLNLSGIKAGDSLNISVSQGGLTAGPYNIGSWGGGGDGGPITVSAIHRSYRQIAPDSVRFEVDLSSSNFDTPGPTGSEVYDRRLHELIYLWDLDDPGTWDAPRNVLPEWRDRSKAKGPSVAHLYRDADTYTVSVLVIEPSTGKTATGSVTFDVGDPQDFYGDANTIYVNNVNDDDWSYVPAGVPSGNKINVDSLTKIFVSPNRIPDATWASFQGGNAKRWRFKRGSTYEVSIYFDGLDAPDIMVDDYGDPNEPNPKFTTVVGGTGQELFNFRSGYGHDEQAGRGRDPLTSPPDFRFRNIDFQGIFDSTVTPAVDLTVERETCMWLLGAQTVMIADCNIDGYGASNFVFNVNGLPFPGKVHMDNCALTNFGGQYPVSISKTSTYDSRIVMTGVKWEQPGDALTSKSGYMGSRSSGRFNTMRFVHMRGCDSFLTEAELTHFQIAKEAQTDGVLVNVHSCNAEGASAFMDTEGLWKQMPDPRMHVNNMIFDGIIYTGGWAAQAAFVAKSTGITIRNSLYNVPAVPAIGSGSYGFLLVEESNDTGSALPDYVKDAPITVYNCTYHHQRTAAQNKDNEATFISHRSDYTTLTGVAEYNNVFHAPNLSIDGNPNMPRTSDGPLSSNVLWAPRMLGKRDPETLVLDTTYATPANAIQDVKPLTGSTALDGATTNPRGFLDITGGSRYGAGVYDEGTVDKGAWQVS